MGSTVYLYKYSWYFLLSQELLGNIITQDISVGIGKEFRHATIHCKAWDKALLYLHVASQNAVICYYFNTYWTTNQSILVCFYKFKLIQVPKKVSQLSVHSCSLLVFYSKVKCLPPTIIMHHADSIFIGSQFDLFLSIWRIWNRSKFVKVPQNFLSIQIVFKSAASNSSFLSHLHNSASGNYFCHILDHKSSILVHLKNLKQIKGCASTTKLSVNSDCSQVGFLKFHFPLAPSQQAASINYFLAAYWTTTQWILVKCKNFKLIQGQPNTIQLPVHSDCLQVGCLQIPSTLKRWFQIHISVNLMWDLGWDNDWKYCIPSKRK